MLLSLFATPAFAAHSECVIADSVPDGSATVSANCTASPFLHQRARSWSTHPAAISRLVLRPLDYVTKRVSGLLARELPLEDSPVAIHPTIPVPSLLAQASDVSDSAFS